MKKTKTKYLMTAAENQPLYHDRGNPSAGLLTTNEGTIIFNPWQNITRGTSSYQRIGDEVYARGMSIRFCYWTNLDRATQFVRIIVVVIPKTAGNIIHDGSNFDLLDAQGSNDTCTGMIKREGVKVLYDKLISMKSTAAGALVPAGYNRFFKKIYLKSKGSCKLKWQQDGSLANKPVGVWVIPYDTYSTLSSSDLGTCAFTYKLYFKDV